MRPSFAGKSRRSLALFVILHGWPDNRPQKTFASGPDVTGTKRPDPAFMSQDLEPGLFASWRWRCGALVDGVGEADGAKKHGGAGPKQNFSSIGRQRHGKAIHSCA